MALSEVEKNLVAGLKLHDISMGKALAVCLLLKQDEQRLDMLEFLLTEEEVTDKEVMRVAHKLAAK